MYDSRHRRIGKTIRQKNIGLQWETVETRDLFIMDGILIRETFCNSQLVTNNVYYVWGSQKAGGVGGIVAVQNNNEMYFPIYDASGNITEYTDMSGAIVAHYEYSPFGEVLVQTGSMANEFKFRFSTKYTEVESGLYYYGYRFYQPSLGRWLNRDPYQRSGRIKPVRFCSNNGINKFDALGLKDLVLPEEKIPMVMISRSLQNLRKKAMMT